MFYRTIFVCLLGFVLVKLVKMDPMEITFKINSRLSNNMSTLTCDHSDEKILQNKYTVYEGEDFKITTKYNSYINHFMCQDYSDEKNNFHYKSDTHTYKNETTFMVRKQMGTLWKCKILANKDVYNIFKTVELYKEHLYAVANCYMKIHVRLKESPLMILVNNMVLPAVRTKLSEKLVDFTAEYQYADGDVVDVTCANLEKNPTLTMEYDMAGTISDYSTMKNLSSNNAIGFVTKMHSGHNNSYMICTYTGTNDYTKVMVRFFKRTEFHIVSIKINGKNLRPNIGNAKNNYHSIDYKYRRSQHINVLCEVERRNDVKMIVMDSQFDKKKVNSYYKIDSKKNNKSNISFNPLSNMDSKLSCSTDYDNGSIAEQNTIHFTDGNFPIVQYPLDMEILSNGSVMELYSGYQLKIIFYEFEDGETLTLKCGPLHRPFLGPLLYIEFEGSECKTDGCNVSNSKSINVIRKGENTEIICYLKEEADHSKGETVDSVRNEIRVILRKRVLTSTTTTTSTTSTSTPKATPAPEYSVGRISSTTSSTITVTSESLKDSAEEPRLGWKTLAVIGCSIACIVIICVSIVIIKLRKRNHSQRGPHNRNYENLGEPSEASIPAHPPQWENHYAVPVDRRTDDTTYSVPCQAELYATPTPKNLRNKKQKPVDPTYAVLAVPKGRDQKNTFKETEDPNYSEVYANRKEECYAKVLPKSVRNKMEQDNPYSYVTNEPPYVNTADPEPMYCEPAKAQGGQYANLNSSHYANTNAPEYVEPTYCEPQKRMK